MDCAIVGAIDESVSISPTSVEDLTFYIRFRRVEPSRNNWKTSLLLYIENLLGAARRVGT